MQTFRVLAGFTAPEADAARSAIGKKNVAKLKSMRDKFVDGCQKESGLTEIHATQLFDKIEKFAGYSFPLAHATEYSVISFQSMYLKVHYPPDFYAAALSVLDSDRWLDLIVEAEARGIQVLPPDINHSGTHFAVNDEGNIVAPLTAIKGVSDKSAQAIVEARAKASGAFKTVLDLLDNVDLRRCHKGIQGALDKVGAFATLDFSDPAVVSRVQKDYSWISINQSAVNDPARQSDQLALLPGLARVTSIDRFVAHDGQIKQHIQEAICDKLDSCQGCSLAGQPHVPPRFGRSAKAMIVTDCPTWGEENKSEMVEGLGSEYVREALKVAGLSVGDFYWTTLVKSRKPKGARLANEQINACSKYLDQEIQALQPGLIIALGSTTLKHLIKGSRLTQADAGKVEHVPGLNASVLVGFNPQAIYMDHNKQVVMNDIFKQAKVLMGC